MQRQILYYTDNFLFLSAMNDPQNMHVVLLSGPSSPNAQVLQQEFARKNHMDLMALDLGDNDETYFFDIVNDYFTTQVAFAQYSDTLLNLLNAESGIQEMVHHASMTLENPVYVFDSDFMLLAGDLDTIRDFDPEGVYLTETGISTEGFALMNQGDHIHQHVKNSEEPIVITHPQLGFEQMICNISTKKDLGHIVLCASSHPFQGIEASVIKLLRTAIFEQMQKDTFIRNNKGFHYEFFLSDLLDGKITTQEQFRNRLSYVNGAFSDYNYCLVADIAKCTTTHSPAIIRDSFEKTFQDSKAFIYNGEIIVILSKTGTHVLSDMEKNAIKKICQSHGLYLGVSNPFSDILELKRYYKQALRAVELGLSYTDLPSLFIYEDFAFDHIKSVFLQSESAEAFCHPGLKKLISYDKDHHTDFSDTVYTYLTHGQNLAAAAEALHTHRNTLSYRLQKAFQIMGTNCEHYQDQKYLLLSYDLIR